MFYLRKCLEDIRWVQSTRSETLQSFTLLFFLLLLEGFRNLLLRSPFDSLNERRNLIRKLLLVFDVGDLNALEKRPDASTRICLELFRKLQHVLHANALMSNVSHQLVLLFHLEVDAIDDEIVGGIFVHQ